MTQIYIVEQPHNGITKLFSKPELAVTYAENFAREQCECLADDEDAENPFTAALKTPKKEILAFWNEYHMDESEFDLMIEITEYVVDEDIEEAQ